MLDYYKCKYFITNPSYCSCFPERTRQIFMTGTRANTPLDKKNIFTIEECNDNGDITKMSFVSGNSGIGYFGLDTPLPLMRFLDFAKPIDEYEIFEEKEKWDEQYKILESEFAEAYSDYKIAKEKLSQDYKNKQFLKECSKARRKKNTTQSLLRRFVGLKNF